MPVQLAGLRSVEVPVRERGEAGRRVGAFALGPGRRRVDLGPLLDGREAGHSQQFLITDRGRSDACADHGEDLCGRAPRSDRTVQLATIGADRGARASGVHSVRGLCVPGLCVDDLACCRRKIGERRLGSAKIVGGWARLRWARWRRARSRWARWRRRGVESPVERRGLAFPEVFEIFVQLARAAATDHEAASAHSATAQDAVLPELRQA